MIRKMVLNPAYIGERVLRGQIVGDGMWEGLVSEDGYWPAVRLLQQLATGIKSDNGSMGAYLSAVSLPGEAARERVGLAVSDVRTPWPAVAAAIPASLGNGACPAVPSSVTSAELWRISEDATAVHYLSEPAPATHAHDLPSQHRGLAAIRTTRDLGADQTRPFEVLGLLRRHVRDHLLQHPSRRGTGVRHPRQQLAYLPPRCDLSRPHG